MINNTTQWNEKLSLTGSKSSALYHILNGHKPRKPEYQRAFLNAFHTDLSHGISWENLFDT